MSLITTTIKDTILRCTNCAVAHKIILALYYTLIRFSLEDTDSNFTIIVILRSSLEHFPAMNSENQYGLIDHVKAVGTERRKKKDLISLCMHRLIRSFICLRE